ncbi:MAG: hypothetical protein ACFFCS_03615 [Candidatus Hodarchaeota archaeon]
MNGLHKASGIIGIIASGLMLFAIAVLLVLTSLIGITFISSSGMVSWIIGAAIAILAMVGGILTLKEATAGPVLLLVGGSRGFSSGSGACFYPY